MSFPSMSKKYPKIPKMWNRSKAINIKKYSSSVKGGKEDGRRKEKYK